MASATQAPSATQLRNIIQELFRTPRLLDPSKKENLSYLQTLAVKIPDLTSSQLPPLNVTVLSHFNWIKATSDYVMACGGSWLVYEANYFFHQRYQGAELTPDQLNMLMLRGVAALAALLGGLVLSNVSKLEANTEENLIQENYRIALAFEPFKRLVQLASSMPEKPEESYKDLDDIPLAHLARQEKYQTWSKEWTLAKEAFLRAIAPPKASSEQN